MPQGSALDRFLLALDHGSVNSRQLTLTLIFVFFQRYVVQGMTSGAVK
jgi:hypothetical protein